MEKYFKISSPPFSTKPRAGSKGESLGLGLATGEYAFLASCMTSSELLPSTNPLSALSCISGEKKEKKKNFFHWWQRKVSSSFHMLNGIQDPHEHSFYLRHLSGMCWQISQAEKWMEQLVKHFYCSACFNCSLL